MRILSVTSVRNEGPYLLDWISHHLAAGVTDFLVFSNDCDDGTDAILRMLDKSGIITHVSQERDGRKSVQWQALKAAWKHPLRKGVDWILVSDVDEYVNIHTPSHNFASLLETVPKDTDAILLPWRLFGHNGIVGIESAPVTEQFTRAITPEATYPIAAGMFKTLFRAKGPFNQLGVHRPKQKPEAKAGLPRFVDGAGHPLADGFSRAPHRLSLFGLSNGRSLVELNHYAVRSAGAFLVKRDRGLPNRSHKAIDLAYWVERNFNLVEDRSILRMAPATAQERAKLARIEGLETLHEAALAWHRNRLATLVREPETHQLLTHILTASGSTVLPEQLQHQLVRWYQEAHKNASANQGRKTGK